MNKFNEILIFLALLYPISPHAFGQLNINEAPVGKIAGSKNLMGIIADILIYINERNYGAQDYLNLRQASRVFRDSLDPHCERHEMAMEEASYQKAAQRIEKIFAKGGASL